MILVAVAKAFLFKTSKDRQSLTDLFEKTLETELGILNNLL